ncbi:pleiotropic drug resistance protein 3 isoform X1 [Coffea arabica]|uniref:Pleiotropic drug resistance protein 3 isoform X1 n=1 Tax=Coffea arabica TaxID=13443 RepID=A0ABM4WL29_COFAR
MASLVGTDEIESIRNELSEVGSSLRFSLRRLSSSFRSSVLSTGRDSNLDEETALQWAAIERLPTFERLRSSLFDEPDGNEAEDKRKRVIDVTKLSAPERHVFVERLIKHIEHDNLRLLQKMRKRMNKVGLEFPSVEVRYDDLHVEADCEVVEGKPLPTLWNSFKSSLPDITRLLGFKSVVSKISIIDGVSGIIKPGRMTLLLGPPGCGKTTLLKALSGNLNQSLKVTGDISYNGYKLTEFVPQKTSAYISQYDLHNGEMTLRETLDFSLRCQGVGSRAEIMTELSRREKEAGILPDPDIDTYMKASSVEGQKTTLRTDYILKILGIDTCADTLVGDPMRRGVSGGQKKRLTTGEMIVGPTRALFMDEISNGLDSSTTYQIVACLQQLAHILDATILISLLQPAPETFDLFDDIILMSEGKIVYHGPRSSALEFFESCGFRCPERKGVADFLQEVISGKDQAQYWFTTEETYNYISVDAFSRKFKQSSYGEKLREQLSAPSVKSKSRKDAMTFTAYSLPKWELFRACISREFLLMKRNRFVYIFKSAQISISASISMTIFLRTMMSFDLLHANKYMGALFFAGGLLVVNGLPELSMTVGRLAVFYKQRDLLFYPAWAYAIPSAILKVPLSLFEAVIWTSLTYYVIGYDPEIGRFFRHLIVLFALHVASISMYRFVASVCRTVVSASMVGLLTLLFVFAFCGFIIPRPSMPNWLKWGFWVSPLSYGEIGLTLNEFLSSRWKKMLPTNTSIGQKTLDARGLNFEGYFFWISVGALFGFTLLFNLGFTLALTYLNPVGSRAIISREKYSQEQRTKKLDVIDHAEEKSSNPSLATTTESQKAGKMVLPFEPLTVVFQDLQYYVEIPMALKERGFPEKRLQLLCDITGTLRPGVLTALMGASGAGKTTLLDVLAGRKTSGTVEGEIKIGGFPKVQRTFARISGYCEQTDIHSPQITVEESVIFSAWLRLHPQIDSETKIDFVKEVLETIELDGIKDALVGIPGVNGLSTEQRKRLTIAVEFVANPSIFFLDEPTTGLDARAAAIVIRAIRNVASTGRTIVCTIHQPGIDIFEAFDELILLKSGGRMIYCGPLGQHSSEVIQYFEGIPGVPKIRNNYNPATWMLEVTCTSSEAELGVDFAEIYKSSSLYENNKELANTLSSPPIGREALDFPTQYAQNGWRQFKTCLWKQHWSYWRSPSYNLMRFMFMIITSLIFGALFWKQGKKIENQQNLFSILGSMFIAMFFCGVYNSSSILPYVSTERTVLYRERFAGMYASWAYTLAQVIIEIPYVFIQVLAFTVITYPMIGYYWSAYKVFWYIYSMFCTLLFFNCTGMMIVSITPSFPVAAVLQSAFYNIYYLVAGFLIPRPQIPKWWVWLYYLAPTSWTLNGMLTSQYGDIDKPIEVFGEPTTVSKFLRDYFGFHHDQLPIVAVILILYPIVLACLFSYFVSKLNFQKR